MKLYLTFFFFLLSTCLCNGQQKLSQFDWLRGQRINNYVQIKLQNNVIKWRDGEDENAHGNYFFMSTSESQPTVFRARKPKMNLQLSFLNPINYSVSITQTDQEDPLFATTSKFSESLINVANLVSSGQLEGFSAPTGDVSSTNTDKKEGGQKISDVLESILNQKKGTVNDTQTNSLPPGIANWFLWYDSQAQLNKIDKNSPNNILIENFDRILTQKKSDLEKAKTVLKTKKGKKITEAAFQAAQSKARSDTASINAQIKFFQQNLTSAKGNQIVACFPLEPIKLLITRVLEAEEYVHGSFKIDNANGAANQNKEKIFNDYIKTIISNLQSAYSYSSLREAKNNAEITLSALSKKQETLLSHLKDVQSFGSLATPASIDLDFCKTFHLYTQSEFTSYSSDVLNVIQKRGELIDQLQQLIKAVNNYLDEDTTREVVINIGKMRSIAITIVERKILLENSNISIIQAEKPVSAYCIVNEISWAVPELAGGLAFPTDLTFTNYGVDLLNADNYQVVDRGDKRTYILAGAFLNFIFDAKLSPGVFPMLQLGVTTGKQYPSILGGFGFRFYPNKSISMGWVGAFDQQLTTYKLGSQLPVGDKQKFDDSLQYKLKGGGLYIAFQWKF